MNVVLLGAPGSGKGTQAEYLEAELGLTHIASGDLFRSHLNQQTDLGILAHQYMTQGQLVPDAVVIAMIRDRLLRGDTGKGVLFDGFPRTIGQAEALDQMMAELGRKLNVVLYIEVPDEELVQRLSGRLICRECQVPFHRRFKPFQYCPSDRCQGEYLYQRDDDQPDTVKARLVTFHTETAPLIDYYQQAKILLRVPGAGAIDQVKQATLAAMQQIK